MVVSRFVLLLGLALISTVVATADDLMLSSRPTILPPAAPGKSDDPCEFYDLKNLLDRLEHNFELYNTTLLVETCDNICQLIYGTGNPDLSGIGMMISYGIQGIVSLIFGPVFLFAVIAFDGQTNPFSYFRSHENRSRWVNITLQLAAPTHKLNSFTAACVVISTAIRQDPVPMIEAQFIELLSQYQIFMCLLGSTLYVFCCPVDSNIQCLLHLTLFAVTAGCLGKQLELRQKVVLPTEGGNWHYKISRMISKDCNLLKGYPPAASFYSINHSSAGVFILFCCTCFACGITVLLVLDRLGSNSTHVRLILQPFWDARSWLSSTRLFSWRDRARGCLRAGFLITLCVSIIFTVLTSFGTVDSCISIKASRDRMREYVKDEYQDNVWGFGQILTVAVWVVWLVDAIFLVVEAFLPVRFVRPERRRASNDIGPSTPRPNQQEPSQPLSTIPEGQEQTTGVGGLAYHTSYIELDITDSRTLRSRPTWPRNDRDAYLPQ